MNTQQVQLINLGLLWHKFVRLSEQVSSEVIKKIYQNKANEVFNKYFDIWIELNKYELQIKFISTYVERKETDEKEIEKLLNSSAFIDFCMDICCQTL